MREKNQTSTLKIGSINIFSKSIVQIYFQFYYILEIDITNIFSIQLYSIIKSGLS